MAKLEIEIFQYFDPILFLKALYKKRKEEKKKYSYELFTSECGFENSNLMFLVISGSRKLTVKAGKTIARNLPLRKHRRNYFLALIEVYNAKTVEEREKYYNEALQCRIDSLDDPQEKALLRYLSTWHHCIVRELVCLPQFKPDAKWISKQVVPAITEEQARSSWELLQEIGFVFFDAGSNRWVQKDTFIHPSSGLQNLVMVRYHHQMLEIARHQAFQVEKPDRNYESLTFSVSEEAEGKLSSLINEFCDKIVEEFSDVKDPDRVVQFNLNYFPVSRGDDNEA